VFLLLWYFESTIEAKEILKCDGEDTYIKQQDPSEKLQLISTLTDQRFPVLKELIIGHFWPKHNITTTRKPSTTVPQTESTTYYSNSTTEGWNTTTSAPKSTTYYSNSTTEGWNTTTSAPKSTTYHYNSTTEGWNTTTSAPKSTTYHYNSTTEGWNTTTLTPESTTYDSTSTSYITHHHFRRRTTRKIPVLTRYRPTEF